MDSVENAVPKWARHCFQATLLACVLLLTPRAAVFGQGETEGLPLDNFQFKAGHNSYDEDEDMDDQIDNFNVWAVELDLQWESDCGPCITVDHCCIEVPGCWGEQRLHESIAEILRSTEIERRVTFIWLDIKDSGSGNSWCHEQWPPNRREIIRETLVDLIGAERIYTKSDFELDFQANGSRWPSWQSLRDRGKHFILILEDGLGDGLEDGVPVPGKADDPVLFIAVGSRQEAEQHFPWATFVNIEGANTTSEVPIANDRYLHRAWFDYNTNDHETWERAISRGFNLVSSDDVDGDYTIADPRAHAPEPLYVDFAAVGRLWGTRAFPMNAFGPAVARASPGSTLRVRPGSYASSPVFDKPLTVKIDSRYSGAVVIGESCHLEGSGAFRVYPSGQIKIH